MNHQKRLLFEMVSNYLVMTNDDMALVREYAAGGSEGAFEEPVQRHVHLVHSAALRRTSDPHLAEEITQAVFVILDRKVSIRLAAQEF